MRRARRYRVARVDYDTVRVYLADGYELSGRGGPEIYHFRVVCYPMLTAGFVREVGATRAICRELRPIGETLWTAPDKLLATIRKEARKRCDRIDRDNRI